MREFLGDWSAPPINREARINRRTGDTQGRRVQAAGHREPTPILRLRWQGSADDWAIGIYKASTGQYSENELPGAFGGATGTPEQGIDETFILYAGPRTGN